MTATVDEYNYSTFTTSEARGKTKVFASVVHAGEEAPDFELPTLDGEMVRLSQFKGEKYVVLEFGAITWPPFVGEVSPFNQLQQKYADKGFEFFTVYVREPHPGENYTEHQSWEQKLQYAKECREQDGIETKMLIDGLDGAMHQAYGEMPNMAFIIGKDGKVVYKSMWTDHADIEAMIQTLLGVEDATANGLRSRPSYTERISYVTGYAPEISSKVLGRAGPKAISDFQTAIGSPRPAH